MAEISLQIDVQSLMKSSPGLQVLSADEFGKIFEAVLKLPLEKQRRISEILQNEQTELKSIRTEYDQKRAELLQEYIENVKVQEKTMIRDFQKELESVETVKEDKILDQLLDKINKL